VVTPSRNLLIVHTPPQQALDDWIAIKQRIEETAPDIEVNIATNRQPNSATVRWQIKRPSLVFSPVRLIDFAPRGGKIYCGHVLGKYEQVRRLAALGIATPRTGILSRDTVLDPAQWGEYVVVKPDNGNAGLGIRLVPTRDLPARYDELTGIIKDQFIVQPYVDHTVNGCPEDYRVLSLFGRVLYCVSHRWDDPLPPLAQVASDPNGIIASNDPGAGESPSTLCYDPEIIALAERAHQAFPECPLIGVDIVREQTTGQLHVLETNPHGAVWHFSSPFARTLSPDAVRQRYSQFNALERTADLLIEKTRAEAA